MCKTYKKIKCIEKRFSEKNLRLIISSSMRIVILLILFQIISGSFSRLAGVGLIRNVRGLNVGEQHVTPSPRTVTQKFRVEFPSDEKVNTTPKSQVKVPSDDFFDPKIREAVMLLLV